MSRDLKALALQGAEVFIRVLPRVALGGVIGSIKWMFAMGVFGGLLALITWWMWHGEDHVPSWLRFSLLLTPLVLGCAGIYVGALRGVLRALVKQMSEHRLVAYVYAQVKPAALAALKAAPLGDAKALAKSTRAGVRRLFEEEQAALDASPSLVRSLAGRAQRVLAASAVDYIGNSESREDALAKVETMGISKLEEIAADTLSDLFSTHVTITLGISFVLALLPQAIWWVIR